jgi:hypothetical protein
MWKPGRLTFGARVAGVPISRFATAAIAAPDLVR